MPSFTKRKHEWILSYWRRALRECGGNVNKAAKVHQVNRTYLHKLVVNLGLRAPSR